MNFKAAEKFLLTLFNSHNYVADLQAKRTHTTRKVVERCQNGTEIIISFPGYKAMTKQGKVIYDYRVDIKKEAICTALSHTNIIVDIYNKIAVGNMDAKKLSTVLIEVAKEGLLNLSNYQDRLCYQSSLPSEPLKDRAQQAHGSKFYNRLGNAFDLTIEELFVAIKWIVLQEDVNYPIARGFEGRKMPFARYIESAYVAYNAANCLPNNLGVSDINQGTTTANHTLEEVISRALTHSRPKPWPEINYNGINRISE